MLDIKIWFRLVFVASAVAILPFGRVQSAFAGNTLTAAQWREDLHYLTDQIQKVHPRPFHHISRLEFETQVSQVNVAIPTLSDHEIELEFARIVALLGEGHSRISLPGLPDPMSDVPEVTPFKQESLAFHRIPVRLYSFADGLFIVAATAQYRSLIGAQVLQIGDRSAQSALDAVKSKSPNATIALVYTDDPFSKAVASATRDQDA